MKKPLFGVAVMVAGLVLGGASLARAQDVVKVNAPFPFVVDGHVLPAGQYTVKAATDSLGVISVTSRDGQTAAFTTVIDANGTRAKHAAFEFKKYGTTYFLWKIDVPGDISREVPLQSRAVADTLARLAADHYRATGGEPANGAGGQR